jgi:hypothetical protein
MKRRTALLGGLATLGGLALPRLAARSSKS